MQDRVVSREDWPRARLDRGPVNGAADWLCLAAAPTFAAMALLTGVLGGGPMEMICADASPLGGMVPMYLLMSAFHAAPWLRLFARRIGHPNIQGEKR